MKKRFLKKIICMLMVFTLVLTTLLGNANIAMAEPTNTKDFLKIPHESEDSDAWTKKISAGGYSSFKSEKSKALVVDEAYGYKLFRTDQTDFKVLDGTTSSAPETFNGDEQKLSESMKNSDKWKWFDLSKSGNSAGKIEVKITNQKIYQPSEGNYIFVDVVRTITRIDENDALGGKGWVALGRELTDTMYIGVDEVSTKNTFYQAGTNKKISLKTNISVADIDVWQYVMVGADKIVGQYVSDDTDLWYGEDGDNVVYASRNDTNYSGEACSYAAFTFEGTSFTYTFGRCLTEGEGDSMVFLPPTNMFQYLGSGQNMFRIPPAPPIKRVSNNNGEKVIHNELSNLAQKWTYYINQPTPTDIPEKFYYDKFEFHDDVDTCLNIEDIRIVATDKDGVEDDVTKWFDITKAGNKVRASMKSEHLNNAQSYQKVSYEMEIDVCWRVSENFRAENSDYITKWKEHGHYNADMNILNVKNEASTEIDKWPPQTTNRVDTDVHLPELHITKDVNRYEHQVGDRIDYTVKVWNTNEKASAAYWWIEDTSLPDTVQLDFSSIKVDGIPEQIYTLEQQGNGWVLKSKGKATLSYGTVITITYSATALKEGNGTLVDNTAKAGALGIPEKSDTEQVYINSPKVDVRKSAPQRKYKVGDVVGYTVEIDNRNSGTFMRDIVLKDAVTTPGMKIKEGTLAVMVGGKDVTSQLDVTFEDNGKGFTINTPYNLKAGTIPCIDRTPYSTITNWVDKIVVTYDAVITEEAEESLDNMFTVPATPNTNGDVIKDDPDIPSGGGDDTESVPMKQPQLEIIKTSDKQTYKVGETGKYTLEVKQIREELIAKNVVVTDAFEQTVGMTYDADSIKVMLNKEDITSKCNVSVENNTFKIVTNSNLTDEDKLTVSYDVKFLQTGEYKNTAVASSDNTPEDEDDNKVTVEGDAPKLAIEKKSDKQIYKVGETGKYTLIVKQTKEGLVAENLVVTDKFEQTEGIVINKKSVKVMFNKEDITGKCTITQTDTNFSVITGMNVTDKDVITVTYDVLFEKVGEYKNTAAASSDNTPEDEDDNKVTVEEPETTTEPPEITTTTPEPETTTEQPETTRKTTPAPSYNAPQTGGEAFSIVLFVALAGIAVGLILLLLGRKKLRKGNEN